MKRESPLMSSRNATREDFEYVIEQMKSKQINPKGFITTMYLLKTLKKNLKIGWPSLSLAMKVLFGRFSLKSFSLINF